MENNTENQTKKTVRKKLVVKTFEKKPVRTVKEKKQKPPSKKMAFVALIGEPNAGKSTLLNKIIGSKISIVTPKVQTTRTRINGIRNFGDTQIVFTDTPGIFKTSQKMNNKLNKLIVQAAIDTVDEVDFIALLVDVKKLESENLEKIFTILEKNKKKKILLINKVDKLRDKTKLFEAAAKLTEKASFEAIFMISALKNDGVDQFIKFVADNAKDSPWHYGEDEYTNITERVLAAEITREKLLLSLDKEIPYKLMVETEKWEEGETSVKINQVIYTESEAHKKIIVGKQGQNLKNIGQASRMEISRALGRKAHLYLFVKVDPNWINKRNSYEIDSLQ